MPPPCPASLTLTALPGVPRVQPGDDLAEIVIASLAQASIGLRPGDLLVLAQKIVSKAEDRFVDLGTIEPSRRALELAAKVDKDPRLVEVILRQSRRVVRSRPGVLIVEHRLGLVLANAGVDHSNVEQPEAAGGDERVLLLPVDPDRSARELRAAVSVRLGVAPAVVVADSLGRPWRLGTVGFAIGVAGLRALCDLRGELDLYGRPLRVTEVGHADQLAAAASVLMGQAAEEFPIVHLRGLEPDPAADDASARDLLRPPELDLFR